MTTMPNSSTAASTSAFSSSEIRFELSPLSSNPLGEGRWFKTAGAFIIGDEVLNGKTLDRNYFARYCFKNGIESRLEAGGGDEKCVGTPQRFCFDRGEQTRGAKDHRTHTRRSWVHTQNEERPAREKLAFFLANAETLFVARALYWPVVRLERKFCVFPGILGLFHKMPDGPKAFTTTASVLRTAFPTSDLYLVYFELLVVHFRTNI
ncbi:hypothetical protein BJY52DRAFT_1227957 [Lactarius psammicola]|nr:hypothetical protein BJY52DRAFT_1227957 [Lactarius psammicola]